MLKYVKKFVIQKLSVRFTLSKNNNYFLIV